MPRMPAFLLCLLIAPHPHLKRVRKGEKDFSYFLLRRGCKGEEEVEEEEEEDFSAAVVVEAAVVEVAVEVAVEANGVKNLP